jgi:hypothetical protein
VPVAGLEDARLLTTAQCAHVVARPIEIVGMDEADRAAACHLFRPVAQYRFAARADPDDVAPGVGDQNQIRRGMEDLAAFFDLCSTRGICRLPQSASKQSVQISKYLHRSPGLRPPQAASESPRLYIVTAFGGCSIGRVGAALHAHGISEGPDPCPNYGPNFPRHGRA